MSTKRLYVADEPYWIVRSSVADLRPSAVISDHLHEWHQLLYVSTGVITAWTDVGSWVAPPSRAIWIPAGIRHGLRSVGESAFCTLYLRPDWWATLPVQCAALTVSPLFRELVLRATGNVVLDQRDAVALATATLMLHEFRRSETASFTLPQPVTALTRQAAAWIVENPSQAATIEHLARAVGVGVRTLERRFVSETGLTIGRWRQQLFLSRALEQLAVGTSVKAVASDAGYSTPSAFVARFRSHFGTTPGRYFA